MLFAAILTTGTPKERPRVGRTVATPKVISPLVKLMSIPISNPIIIFSNRSPTLLHAETFFNSLI